MKRSIPPAVDLIRKIERAHEIFRSVLGQATPNEVFEGNELTISDDGKRLYEHMGNGSILAEAVLAFDFPREAGPIDLDHYTTLTGLKAIAASKQLHLHSLEKRLHEDEFATFALEHGLQGYFQDNGRGKRIFEELSHDLFFMSLTKPGNPDETTLWDTFANDGRGVRIRLRVKPKPPADLRQMGYKTGKSTALKRINEALLAAEGLNYVPWTVSRICAFYLPPGYLNEREVRLMVKRHEGGPDRTIKAGSYDVWPISLAVPGAMTGDPWCEVALVEVTCGLRCSEVAVRAALHGTVFSGVPVTVT